MESDLKQGLLAAYRRLMKPLVRILIRNGVAYGEFAEVAKTVYIDVASSDFKVPHRKMSQARIAILTGLTRKEVARLLSGGKEDGEELQSNRNRVTRVLTGWHTDPDFTGPYGLPLELQFEGNRDTPTFQELVKRVSGDMAPRAMLDELLRIGAVIETDAGWYKVLTRTYVPEGIEPDSLERMARVIANFIATIDNNITEKSPELGRLERQVYADHGVKPEDFPRLRRHLIERSQVLLEEIDNWLSQLDKPDPEDERTIFTGLGIYHYVEEKDEQDK